jgi:hypothetical protein
MNRCGIAILCLLNTTVSFARGELRSSPIANGMMLGNAIKGNLILEALFTLIGMGGMALVVYFFYSNFQDETPEDEKCSCGSNKHYKNCHPGSGKRNFEPPGIGEQP